MEGLAAAKPLPSPGSGTAAVGGVELWQQRRWPLLPGPSRSTAALLGDETQAGAVITAGAFRGSTTAAAGTQFRRRQQAPLLLCPAQHIGSIGELACWLAGRDGSEGGEPCQFSSGVPTG